MTITFEVKPNEGIGPIRIGIPRVEVRRLLGEKNLTSSRTRGEAYFDDSIDVAFTDECVSFVGAGFHELFSLSYKGLNPFDVSAPELFRLIGRHEISTHTYNEYEHLFPTQQISLWNATRRYDESGGEDHLTWTQIGIYALGHQAPAEALG